MGNINVGRVLPVFDTLLLLVTTIFGTAGLLRSMEPDSKDLMSPERDRLATEVKVKMAEADELAKRLDGLRQCGALTLDALQTLLYTAGSRQEKLAEIQRIIAEARGKLEGVQTTVQDKFNAVTLENTIHALKAQIEQLERRKQDLEKEITQEDRQRAEMQELQRKLEAIRGELETLRIRIAELELKDPPPSGGRLGLFRNYHRGPFLLLECDDKGVVVYPGSKRIVVGGSTAEMDWLRDEVRRTGAAQLLVRPAGFKESYAKFYELLTEWADKEESAGKTIILNFWPIEANESIQEYLPERS